MRYQVEIDSESLRWLVGDKPAVQGVITGNSAVPTLLGCTVQLYTALGSFIGEHAVSVNATTGAFTFILPDKLASRIDSGIIYVAALEDSTLTKAISGAITSGATSATLASSVAAEAKGFALIDSEWVEYSLSGTTMTLVTRGCFNTTPASHADAAVVKFASVKETCTPYFPFTVRDAIDLSIQN